MKIPPHTNPVALLVIFLIISAAMRAVAQTEVTSWTSVDGTTIWARLDGWDGSRLKLIVQGRAYRVPMTRLAPKSVEKARQMLHLPVDRKVAAAADSQPKAKETQPPLDLVIPPGQTDEMATSKATSPMDLPDFSDPASSTDDNYGNLLPKPETMVPATPATVSEIVLSGSYAMAPAGLPGAVRTAIDAGNRLQTKTYKWGGGRASLEDTGYDCSGSVSYVLIKAGLLGSPLTSGSFTRYGAPGPGKWITIYATNGHVFMTLCGLRLDTGGRGGRGGSGPRWNIHPRNAAGYGMRHPAGF